MSGTLVDAASVNARLAEAAARGESVELILVVRGRVRAAGGDRWRVRAGGTTLTFPSRLVVAATATTERTGGR
jgi:hypothetical protein